MTTNAMPTCPYCSAYHTAMCPKVKAIEYHPNGTVKRVELHDSAQTRYATGGVINKLTA